MPNTMMIARKWANKIGEASYDGNLGIAELVKFSQKATKVQRQAFDSYVKSGDDKKAWGLVQKVVGVKLKGKQFEGEKKSIKIKKSEWNALLKEEKRYLSEGMSKLKSHEAQELYLYIENTYSVYRQLEDIIKNLTRKIKSGKYDHKLAPKLWRHLADTGAKSYAKEHASGVGDAKRIFPGKVRDNVAQVFADEYYERIKDGEFGDVGVKESIQLKEEKRYLSEGMSKLKSHEAQELYLYIENTYSLYRQLESIIENIKRKAKKGNYDHKRAPKLWRYLVDNGAKSYAKEHAGGVKDAARMFPGKVRDNVAQVLADEYLDRIKDGEFGTVGNFNARVESIQLKEAEDQSWDVAVGYKLGLNKSSIVEKFKKSLVKWMKKYSGEFRHSVKEGKFEYAIWKFPNQNSAKRFWGAIVNNWRSLGMAEGSVSATMVKDGLKINRSSFTESKKMYPATKMDEVKFKKNKKAYMQESAIIKEALSLGKKDKAVVIAFADEQPAKGRKLSTDGKRLDGNWMGGKGIAEWKNKKVHLNDLGSKAAQTVQKMVKRFVPRVVIVESEYYHLPVIEEIGKVMVKHKKTGNVYLVSKKYAKQHPEMYDKPSKDEKKAGKEKIKGRKKEKKATGKATKARDKYLDKEMKLNYDAVKGVPSAMKAAGTKRSRESIQDFLTKYLKKKKRKINKETFDTLVDEIEFAMVDSEREANPNWLDANESKKINKGKKQLKEFSAKAHYKKYQDKFRMGGEDLKNFSPIKGMEGPFRFKSGFILYYDPKEGKYYDRRRDMYLSNKEAQIQARV
jgi:hypothetical protein